MIKQNTKKPYFARSISLFLVAFVITVTLFFFSRVSFNLVFAPTSLEYSKFLPDLIQAYWVGFRFDAKVVTILFLFPILFLYLLTIFPKKWIENYFHFLPSLLSSLILFSVIILIADFYYYRFYQSHLDVIAFGVFEDDTRLILLTIWQDYPVIWGLIGLTFLFFFVRYILHSVQLLLMQKFNKIVNIEAVLIGITFIVLVIMSGRGSFGLFPIGDQDKVVSSEKFINLMVTNGLVELYEAIEERKQSKLDIDPKKIIESFGFKSSAEALSLLTGDETTKQKTDEQVFQSFFVKNNGQSNTRRNVVFALKESMSGHLLNYHKSNNNLLGDLEKHFEQDYLFKNFISAENGTAVTLEHLLLNTYVFPISQSQHQDLVFKTAITLPFKQAGYKTVFITGGSLGWRNLDRFLPIQGFDEVIGRTKIIKKYPKAKTSDWGVFDEYMYRYALDYLSNNHEKPIFLFLLSTTHHPPFMVPDDYKVLPISLPNEIEDKLIHNEEKAKLVLSTYQYANNQLGRFISKIKNSTLKKTTVVAATGDHNTRDLIHYPATEDQFHRIMVPFYLYLPKDLREQGEYKKNRFGSHKDIFPTIFEKVLQNQKYFLSGNNLLSSKTQFGMGYWGLFERTITVNKEGMLDINDTKQFFKWKNKQIPQRSDYNTQLDEFSIKLNAYLALMHWQINWQIKQNNL